VCLLPLRCRNCSDNRPICSGLPSLGREERSEKSWRRRRPRHAFHHRGRVDADLQADGDGGHHRPELLAALARGAVRALGARLRVRRRVPHLAPRGAPRRAPPGRRVLAAAGTAPQGAARGAVRRRGVAAVPPGHPPGVAARVPAHLLLRPPQPAHRHCHLRWRRHILLLHPVSLLLYLFLFFRFF
jgi:hypothetical protein